MIYCLLKVICIIYHLCTYACTPYSQDFVINNYKEAYIDLMIDIELMWEVLQSQLRDIIMKYAVNKKRRQNEQEIRLVRDINEMETVIVSNINDDEWVQTLKDKKLTWKN